jgi:hypothetical protein
MASADVFSNFYNSSQDPRWWLVDDDSEQARILFGVMHTLDAECADRETWCWRALTRYAGLTQTDYAAARTTPRKPKEYLYNIIASIVDTLVAKMANTDIKVTCLTDGGDYEQQERAKSMDQLVEGVFYGAKMRVVGPECLRDACVMDIGALKVFEDQDTKGKINLERVMPLELMVDPQDALYGCPRVLLQRKAVNRDVLASRYPKFKKQIMEVPPESSLLKTFAALADQILVVEAWHLPSTPDSTDGQHTIAIGNQVLFREPWKKQTFPFAFLRFETQPWGFWGRSVAFILDGLQEELNVLVRKQQQGLYLNAVTHYYVNKAAGINTDELNNLDGGIVEGTGTMEEALSVITPNPVSPQVIAQIENLYRKGFELIGVSQLAAQSQKPPDLESAAALQTYHDIGTERFTMLGKQYEQFYMDAAALVIDLAREIHERDGKFSVQVPGADFMNSVQWLDGALENDEFVMKIYPTSLLPKDPAGRLSAVTSLAQSNMFDPPTLLGLLDYPDIKAVNSLATAPLENILWQISGILKKGKKGYMAPEPYQDLNLGLKLFTEAYLKAQRQNVAEDKLDLLRTWIEQAKALQGTTLPPPTAPPPAQLGQPGPTPTGPYLPTNAGPAPAPAPQ